MLLNQLTPAAMLARAGLLATMLRCPTLTNSLTHSLTH
jgi:hypothetical protein